MFTTKPRIYLCDGIETCEQVEGDPSLSSGPKIQKTNKKVKSWYIKETQGDNYSIESCLCWGIIRKLETNPPTLICEGHESCQEIIDTYDIDQRTAIIDQILRRQYEHALNEIQRDFFEREIRIQRTKYLNLLHQHYSGG